MRFETPLILKMAFVFPYLLLLFKLVFFSDVLTKLIDDYKRTT